MCYKMNEKFDVLVVNFQTELVAACFNLAGYLADTIEIDYMTFSILYDRVRYYHKLLKRDLLKEMKSE